MRLHVRTSKGTNDATVLHVSGHLVVGDAASKLQENVTRQAARRLVVDIASVNVIDGAGLGTLVWLRNWAVSSGRKLTFANPTARVLELLELTRLDAVLDLCTTEEKPVARLAGSSASIQCCSAAVR